MSSTELNAGASATLRQNSHTVSSLLRRALLGITLLVAFTVLLAWLYDAGISATASSDANKVAEISTSG